MAVNILGKAPSQLKNVDAIPSTYARFLSLGSFQTAAPPLSPAQVISLFFPLAQNPIFFSLSQFTGSFR